MEMRSILSFLRRFWFGILTIHGTGIKHSCNSDTCNDLTKDRNFEKSQTENGQMVVRRVMVEVSTNKILASVASLDCKGLDRGSYVILLDT